MFIMGRRLLGWVVACCIVAGGFANQAQAARIDNARAWSTVSCTYRASGLPIELAVPSVLPRGAIVLDRNQQAEVPSAQCKRATAGPAVTTYLIAVVADSVSTGLPPNSARFGIRLEGTEYWGVTDGSSMDLIETQLTYTVPACSASELAAGACPVLDVSPPVNLLIRKETDEGVSIGDVDLGNVWVYEIGLREMGGTDNEQAGITSYVSPEVHLNASSATCTWDKSSIDLTLGAVSLDAIPHVLDSVDSSIGVLTSQGCQGFKGNVKIWMNGKEAAAGENFFDTGLGAGLVVRMYMKRDNTWTRLSRNRPYDNTPPATGTTWEFRADLMRSQGDVSPGPINVPITMLIGYE